uniref:Putative Kunitz family trypsin and protease inhibitor protein n=1 Tax=Davidia involucrata TaxID=16924 RepID=A0A5B7CD80_DAVIN
MKATLLLLSFLLFALSINALLGAANNGLDPVLDAAGEEVQTGEGYYVVPHIFALGGGLTLGKNRNGNTCPLDVVQSPFEVDSGLPVAFSPLDGEGIVRVSADLDIKFLTTTTICPESTMWEVGDYDESVGQTFITTGGVGGTVFNRFRIEKYSELSSLPWYKLVYCRARMVCQNIGIFIDNGVKRLALCDEPYVVVLVKAGGSQIKKVTAAHNIY